MCDPDGITRVRLMRITRLGQGVDATGDLDQAAIERTVAVLEEYRKITDDAGCKRPDSSPPRRCEMRGNGGGIPARRQRGGGICRRAHFG